MRKLTFTGCLLWVAGLIVFLVGFNLTGSTKEWMTTVGSIVFLVGLGINGYVWMKKKNDSDQ
ncbi:MAG: hypothetical protein J6Y48_05055 [Clostridia bacterium]|nr:hypothetical protein [Clostridia bacterium]